MTKVITKTDNWCYQCGYFNTFIFRIVGECTNANLEHNGHVLTMTHPACEQFETKK